MQRRSFSTSRAPFCFDSGWVDRIRVLEGLVDAEVTALSALDSTSPARFCRFLSSASMESLAGLDYSSLDSQG